MNLLGLINFALSCQLILWDILNRSCIFIKHFFLGGGDKVNLKSSQSETSIKMQNRAKEIKTGPAPLRTGVQLGDCPSPVASLASIDIYILLRPKVRVHHLSLLRGGPPPPPPPPNALAGLCLSDRKVALSVFELVIDVALNANVRNRHMS